MKDYKEENSLINTFTTTDTNVGTNERLASIVGGAGLIAYGISRKDGLGAILGILGGGLAFRGATGHCQVYESLGMNSSKERAFSLAKSNKKSNNWLTGKVEVTKSVTINKSAEELFKFWRNFENLPQFMNHLESVTNKEGKTSHWKAKAPLRAIRSNGMRKSSAKAKTNLLRGVQKKARTFRIPAESNSIRRKIAERKSKLI